MFRKNWVFPVPRGEWMEGSHGHQALGSATCRISLTSQSGCWSSSNHSIGSSKKEELDEWEKGLVFGRLPGSLTSILRLL